MIEPIAVFRISKWLWMIPAWNNVMNDDSALNIIADLQTSWLSRLKKKHSMGLEDFIWVAALFRKNYAIQVVISVLRLSSTNGLQKWTYKLTRTIHIFSWNARRIEKKTTNILTMKMWCAVMW